MFQKALIKFFLLNTRFPAVLGDQAGSVLSIFGDLGVLRATYNGKP